MENYSFERFTGEDTKLHYDKHDNNVVRGVLFDKETGDKTGELQYLRKTRELTFTPDKAYAKLVGDKEFEKELLKYIRQFLKNNKPPKYSPTKLAERDLNRISEGINNCTGPGSSALKLTATFFYTHNGERKSISTTSFHAQSAVMMACIEQGKKPKENPVIHIETDKDAMQRSKTQNVYLKDLDEVKVGKRTAWQSHKNKMRKEAKRIQAASAYYHSPLDLKVDEIFGYTR